MMQETLKEPYAEVLDDIKTLNDLKITLVETDLEYFEKDDLKKLVVLLEDSLSSASQLVISIESEEVDADVDGNNQK